MTAARQMEAMKPEQLALPGFTPSSKPPHPDPV
jgi:hypothetical protein